MQQIGTIPLQKLSPRSQSSAPALPAAKPEFDRLCDIELPCLVCWRPDDGPWELRREFLEPERSRLEARRVSLEQSLRPFESSERHQIEATLAAMFSGFRSMRQRNDAAENTLQITLAVLREFPGWAIHEACWKIVKRQTDLDDRWPPSDAEIYGVCDDIVKGWREKARVVSRLLGAKIAHNRKK